MNDERWEHTAFEFHGADQYSAKANALAKEGWELVTVTATAFLPAIGLRYAAFFKRRVAG